MKPQQWWEPGRAGGMLSRRWAQVHVFPLPNLQAAELETSLRYRVQALLPSADSPLRTRLFRVAGKRYGLVIVDRLPEDRPPEDALAVGMPLFLPPSWPAECLLAVSGPEGWEVHSYEARVLKASFPPGPATSPFLAQVREQHREIPAVWAAPDPELADAPPSWAQPAPEWKSPVWGISWATPSVSRWPLVLGSALLLVGVLALVLASVTALQSKADRNQRWEAWIKVARGQTASQVISQASLSEAQSRLGVPLEWVLDGLASAWPEGVEIRSLSLRGDRLTFTARAASALAAMANLARQPLGVNLRVLQIRPVGGNEEFDVEGEVSP